MPNQTPMTLRMYHAVCSFVVVFSFFPIRHTSPFPLQQQITPPPALSLAFGTTPSQHTPCIHTTYIAPTQIPSRMFSLA